MLARRDPLIPFVHACRALDLPRATAHRWQAPPAPRTRERAVAVSPRALSPVEREEVIDVLHSERFVDQPPREVYGTLLEQGRYLCSVSTMYRLLAGLQEVRERRNQRPAQHYAVPRLSATAPNQVWTWDISKLATTTVGVFLNLYLVLDLYSRYIVGWMVAQHENSALAQQLIRQTVERLDIPKDQLTLHNDRGAPMTAAGFTDLLAILGIDASKSRPRVSNDNPFSESHFKTLKYQPEYPGRFHDAAHARSFLRRFVSWYNDEHRHTGLNGYTPAAVYTGRHRELALQHQAVLDAAYAQHPLRWIQGPPLAPQPPQLVTINPAPPATIDASPLVNEIVPAELPVVIVTSPREVAAAT